MQEPQISPYGHRHVESVRHAGSLDHRQRRAVDHDNVSATKCERGSRPTRQPCKAQEPPTRELVGHAEPADGLGLNPATGEISGIPGPTTGTGTPQTFTFTVQDSSTPTPQTANQPLDLTIDPP